MNVRTSKYPLCRHTKTDGRLCQSPALIDSAFCHFHRKLRSARHTAVGSGPGFSANVLHSLRNSSSIQHALAMVVSGLASKRIHPKTAGKMIYALQQAGRILKSHEE